MAKTKSVKPKQGEQLLNAAPGEEQVLVGSDASDTVLTRKDKHDTVKHVPKKRSPSAPEETPQQSVPDGNDKSEANERVRLLIESAREHLGPLLLGLAGKTFDPREADAAREAVSTVNHLAAILKTPLVYEGQEVSLSCTIQKSNGRPTLNLRLLGGSEQKVVYAKIAFPHLGLKNQLK